MFRFLSGPGLIYLLLNRFLYFSICWCIFFTFVSGLYHTETVTVLNLISWIPSNTSFKTLLLDGQVPAGDPCLLSASLGPGWDIDLPGRYSLIGNSKFYHIYDQGSVLQRTRWLSEATGKRAYTLNLMDKHTNILSHPQGFPWCIERACA